MGEGARTSDSSNLGLKLVSSGLRCHTGLEHYEGPQDWRCDVDSHLARSQCPLSQSGADIANPAGLL